MPLSINTNIDCWYFTGLSDIHFTVCICFDSQHTLYCCLPSRGGKKYSNDLPITAMASGSLWYCSSNSLPQTSVTRRQNMCIMKFILQMRSVLALLNSFAHRRLNHSLNLASVSYQHIDGSVEVNHTAIF